MNRPTAEHAAPLHSSWCHARVRNRSGSGVLTRTAATRWQQYSFCGTVNDAGITASRQRKRKQEGAPRQADDQAGPPVLHPSSVTEAGWNETKWDGTGRDRKGKENGKGKGKGGNAHRSEKRKTEHEKIPFPAACILVTLVRGGIQANM